MSMKNILRIKRIVPRNKSITSSIAPLQGLSFAYILIPYQPKTRLTQMTTIKQSTVEAIQESKNILVNFEKYGNKTKISTTYYDAEYAYTVHCYATISANKSFRLMSYDTLIDLIKPTEYSAQRTNKATGEDRTMVDEKKVKEVFKVICEELAKRTDRVYQDMYQVIQKKPKEF